MTDLTILTIETPTLGDRSYLVHDGTVAFVVDQVGLHLVGPDAASDAAPDATPESRGSA